MPRHVHGHSWASQRLNWDWGPKKIFSRDWSRCTWAFMGLSETELGFESEIFFQQRVVESGPEVEKKFQPVLRLE